MSESPRTCFGCLASRSIMINCTIRIPFFFFFLGLHELWKLFVHTSNVVKRRQKKVSIHTFFLLYIFIFFFFFHILPRCDTYDTLLLLYRGG